MDIAVSRFPNIICSVWVSSSLKAACCCFFVMSWPMIAEKRKDEISLKALSLICFDDTWGMRVVFKAADNH